MGNNVSRCLFVAAASEFVRHSRTYAYDIRLKAGEGRMSEASDLSRIYLRAGDGEMVRLDNLVAWEPTLGAAAVSRYDPQYSATFYSTPIVPLGQAVDSVVATTEGLMPPGYQVQMTGRAEEFAKTAGYMVFALR